MSSSKQIYNITSNKKDGNISHIKVPYADMSSRISYQTNSYQANTLTKYPLREVIILKSLEEET